MSASKIQDAPVQGPRFLESILEALPNPVFVKDESHRLVLVNDSYCRLMGQAREEILGRADHGFPQEELKVFWEKDDVVFATGEVVENEERFTDAFGRCHVILTRKSLHVDDDGGRFLLGVITDISAREQMEQELRRSRDELDARVQERTVELSRANQLLEEQDRYRTQFLSVLSHELRNPLEPILNALHVIDHVGAGSVPAKSARAVVHRQVDHLTHLVDDLLDVTRISRGKIQLRRQQVDVADALTRTVEDHRALFARREIDLELRLPRERLLVEADPTRIAQIVGNLLQNAAKFTPSGGSVVVSAAREQDFATIRVRDNGVGLAHDMLERAFDPFTQAEDTLHRTSGGLGLGLALVKGLVELQRGRVEAISAGPGTGAEFVVWFPTVEALQPELPLVTTTNGRHRRALVVEDNLDAAETLRMVLEMEGLEVEVAHDGREGLAKARAFHPDLVLCDLGLPVLDGYEVARALRADPELSSSTLVAVTGYALPDDQRRAMDAGFDRHLAKPVPFEELESVLHGSARHH
ncbi:MAG TPA: ATP-binding protein [Anaeromyxobacteraceae bacterium]|nr:ATP-binding protein [Anaeromyxobacteraceae bacterium]